MKAAHKDLQPGRKKMLADEIDKELVRFSKQPPPRRDDVLTNIVRELSSIAQHFPKFPSFIRWVGFNGLNAEAWQYSTFHENRYAPIAQGVARGLKKWIKESHDASPQDIDLALEWIDRIRPVAEGDDAFYLDWDKIFLLNRSHRYAEAAGLLGSVIKTKRNESWVWAEAARSYAEDQPELALACYCRALACSSAPQFAVNIHLELAQMLAERGDFAQANSELLTVINIRQEQGWGINKDIQKLMSSSWYDPSIADAENPKDFYARHSQEALVLCFDAVEVRPATYLGFIVPHQQEAQPKGRKIRPIPKFAVRANDGTSIGILGRGIRAPAFKIGSPVNLIMGRQLESNQESIVQISARTEGAMWDCTDTITGVISQVASEGRRAKVFVNRDEEIAINDDVRIENPPLQLGQGVRFLTTKNQKKGRRDILLVEAGPRPDIDVRTVNGQLDRHAKGHAFVNNAFVPPHLVTSVPADVNEVTAVLVYTKPPKRENYGWRAVAIHAEPQS